MNHVSEHTTGVGNKRFPACLYYDFKGRTSWKAVLLFCASSDENRSEKSQSCLHELGFLHGYSRSAATMTERSSGIKLRARAAMRIEA